MDYLIGSDFVSSLAPGASSSESITVDLCNISPSIPDGTYYIGFYIDALGDVTESLENDNIGYWSSSPISLSCSQPQPNLTFTPNFSTPSINGTNLGITVQALNNGTASAGSSSTIRFYLSLNTSLDASDYEIGSRTISNLAAGSNQVITLNVDVATVTPTVPPGTYYIGFFIDADHNIDESDELDNIGFWSSPQMTISGDPSLANLLFDLSGDNSYSINGSNLTVNAATKNAGSVATSNSTTTHVNLIKPGTSINVLSAGYSAGMPAGVVGPSSNTVTLAPISSGDYTLFGIVDVDNNETESNENDNTYDYGGAVLSIYPDLTIFNSVSAQTTVNPDDVFLLECDIQNIGINNINDPFNVKAYFSYDNVWDTGDQQMGGFTQNALLVSAGSIHIQFIGTIPSNVQVGSAYIIWKIDSEEAIQEQNEGNNTAFIPVTVSIPTTIPTLISPANGSIVNGSSVQLSWNSVNGGLEYWTEIATDTGFSNLWFQGSTGSATQFNLNNLPNDGTIFHWRVAARTTTGWGNYSSPFSFQNGTINAYPDYLPYDLKVNSSVNPTLSAGEAVSGTVWVKNQGNASSTVHSAGRFYYSSNNFFGDGDDQQLGPLTDLQPMAPGEEHLETVNFNIPGNAQPGTRYIFFKADSDGGSNGEVYEGPDGGENNNVISISIVIEQSNRPPSIVNINNQTNALGENVSLYADADDPDGDVIFFSMSGAPMGLSIHSNTGQISGVITGNTGVFLVTITASDGSLSSSITFNWTVIDNSPIANFIASPTTGCENEIISFTDQSSNNPTSWAWDFSPSTIIYVSGTHANSPNPQVQFLSAGNYTVSLTVANSGGSDTQTKSNYISISENVVPQVSISPNSIDICQGTLVSLSAVPTNGGASPTYQWLVNNAVVSTNDVYTASIWQDGDVVKLKMNSSLTCSSPMTVTSLPVVVNVISPPIVTLGTFADVCINDEAFNLSGGVPVGGTYAGVGVSNGQFDPSIAGVGLHQITYTYPDSGQCSSTASQTILVKGLQSCTSQPFTWIPTNLSGLLFGQAQIDGQVAAQGDWIAAFDENGNCAGAYQLTFSNAIAYIALPIYGDDPTTTIDEGIGSGERFSLQLFDASEGTYHDYPTVVKTLFSGWINTNGIPMPGYDDINTIYNFLTRETTDIIDLKAGWNLISFDVSPADKSISSVFSGIPSLEYVTGFDRSSLFYDANGPSFLNTLSEIKDGFGYWVRVGNNETLEVTGMPIATDFNKDLDAGWNLVAYIPALPATPAVHFSNLIATSNLQYVTGFDGGSTFYDPNGLAFLNTLTTLENGFGYWLRVINAVEGMENRQLVEGLKIQPTTNYIFVNAHTNLPATFAGDYVEVINEDNEVVGKMKILSNGYLMTTALYGDEPSTKRLDGIIKGEKLQIRYKNLIADSRIIYDEDKTIYKLDLKFQTPNKFEVFPNPFKEKITIKYILAEDVQVGFVIRDLLGKEVGRLIRENQQGTHLFEWDLSELPEGMYMISLEKDGKLIDSKRIMHTL